MTESKVVLVTGAAKRIGASIASTFHSNGYKILIHAKNSMLEAKKTNVFNSTVFMYHTWINKSSARYHPLPAL